VGGLIVCCTEVDGKGHMWGIEGYMQGHLYGIQPDRLEGVLSLLRMLYDGTRKCRFSPSSCLSEISPFLPLIITGRA